MGSKTSITVIMAERLGNLLTSWKGIWNSMEWCCHSYWPADLQDLPGKSQAGNFRHSRVLKILRNVDGGEESTVSYCLGPTGVIWDGKINVSTEEGTRLREVNGIAQAHTAHWWQNPGLEPSELAYSSYINTMPLLNYMWKIRLIYMAQSENKVTPMIGFSLCSLSILREGLKLYWCQNLLRRQSWCVCSETSWGGGLVGCLPHFASTYVRSDSCQEGQQEGHWNIRS